MKYTKIIIQKKTSKREVINNTDKPGYRYEFKNKNNKKAGGLVYGTFVDKNKVIIFSYEYKAGRDEEHESEYEYLMSDTEYGYYD